MTRHPLPRPRLRGVSHQYAFMSALTLAPVMIAITPGVAPRFVIAVYVLAITALFGVSALYHRGDWGERGRAIMKKLDHSMIFVAIAATYTPIAVFALDGATGTSAPAAAPPAPRNPRRRGWPLHDQKTGESGASMGAGG